MNGNFKSLVLTYKTAPVAVRELVSLNEVGVKQLLKFVREFTTASDVLVVSTCNRTEIYYNSENDYSTEIFSGLSLIKGLAIDLAPYFQKLSDKDAVQHLFEVSIGLDAQVVGDLQISGQVKNAYQWTADENMAGPFLHRLMHTIFFANKRVVQETSFRDGAASISYAAKELAEDVTTGYRDPKVLVVGVGEIGQDVCLNLQESSFKNVTVLNRTTDKAEKLATKCGFKFGGLENLLAEIQHADVIVSSVSGESPLITKELLKQVNIISHKFFIDLSMPRSVEATLEEIPGVIVYNLDDIQEKTNETVERRKASIPMVQAIIAQAITDFEDWSREMVVSPTIQKLKQTLEQIRKEEIARFLKNAKPEEAEKLEEMSRSLMQKILKYPVLQLKAACKRGEAESLTEVLHDLFNLERVEEKKH
ncbi:glutamyl-tRNA reductase [Chryseotalea sanaruensis]|uniref:Glutamyl-tRNA reductase n=1 Tax=Chryseotalea sanaruensis TaxID=2482724 RepID=A0A401UCF8_9BACT|nr:glutamyl-tRNA reductase [Chryseotalea sanaruensis]GCC52578.1 glutamyl-tRNA reductase [Chryseotalea sanaruensis]